MLKDMFGFIFVYHRISMILVNGSMVLCQHVEFPYDVSDQLFAGMLYGTIHMQMVYSRCAFSNVLLNLNFD